MKYPRHLNVVPKLSPEKEESLIEARQGVKKEVRQAPTDDTLRAFSEMFYEWLKEMNFSHETILNRKYHFRRFIAWCEDRGVVRPQEVSQELIERFQKYIYRFRSEKTGETYSFTSQRGMLHSVRVFFTWLRKRGYIAVNPAIDIEMPRIEKRLPRYSLTIEEVEKILTGIQNQINALTAAIVSAQTSGNIQEECLIPSLTDQRANLQAQFQAIAAQENATLNEFSEQEAAALQACGD